MPINTIWNIWITIITYWTILNTISILFIFFWIFITLVTTCTLIFIRTKTIFASNMTIFTQICFGIILFVWWTFYAISFQRTIATLTRIITFRTICLSFIKIAGIAITIWNFTSVRIRWTAYANIFFRTVFTSIITPLTYWWLCFVIWTR